MITMKNFITVLSFFICIQLFACNNKNNELTNSPDNNLNSDSMKLKISIGTNVFTATVYKNESATAFKENLPLTINMRELNGN